MLTQLTTIKCRLALDPANPAYDPLLTAAIQAVTARFDRECRRAFARQVDAAQEFRADATEISATRYPIESVARLELKTSEAGGWVEQAGVEYLIRSACIISLPIQLLAAPKFHEGGSVARVIYTGGFVLPGTVPGPSQTALPADLEQACVEQVAAWFQHRDKLGLLRYWPSGGVYEQFAQWDLLPSVQKVLEAYRRHA